MEKPALVLASQSPRRHALLAQIGVPFESVATDLDETRLQRETPEAYVSRIALAKAHAGRVLTDARLPVLAADTAVVIEDKVLGKPADRADAAAMMRLLSGRTHRVFSAIALVAAHEAQALNVSEVTFRDVSTHETDAYWETGEPRDKAGGYAIQGLGALFIASLDGSYSGVMGLPLIETAQLLAPVGIDCLAARVDTPSASKDL